MVELIRACGELSNDLAPMPGPTILSGATSEAERVRRMATAMFEWWDVLGAGFDHLRIDRRRISEVDDWLRDVERRHRQFAAEAIRHGGGRVDLLTALTTADAWRVLRDSGSSPQQAGNRVAGLIALGQADEPRNKEAWH
jgi:hypothetical protein